MTDLVARPSAASLPSHSRRPLAGRAVLITRPLEQTATLADGIRLLGGEPVLFPAVEIGPPGDPAGLDQLIDDLPRTHLAIFVSPTAVRQAIPRILARLGAWPAGPRPVAIGQGSVAALQALGIGPVLAPSKGSDTEHLLELPDLQRVKGQRALIFRGEGGRELLAETLWQRGAWVDYAECYRRLPPSQDPAPLLARWQAGGIQGVTVTSTELLRNLITALGQPGQALLRQTPLVVSHSRIANAARGLGLDQVVVAGPGNDDLLAALVRQLAHG